MMWHEKGAVERDLLELAKFEASTLSNPYNQPQMAPERKSGGHEIQNSVVYVWCI